MLTKTQRDLDPEGDKRDIEEWKYVGNTIWSLPFVAQH